MAGAAKSLTLESRRSKKRRFPQFSTRVLLGLLIILLLGPGLLFAGALLRRLAAAERERYELEALGTARQLATLIDRDLNGMVTTLGTLTTSTRLRVNDIAGFRGQAEQVARIADADIILRTPDGRELVDTANPLAPAAGTMAPLPVDRGVIETGRPAISGVLVDPASGENYFVVVAPVAIEGELRFLLSLRAPTDRIATLLAEAVAGNWVIGIGDRDGVYVSRVPGHDAFTGKPGVPEFLALAKGGEGSFRSRNPFGDEVLAGYARTALGNWLVAASVPVDFIEAPLRREILGFAGFGILAFGIAMVLVLQLWRAASRPLRDLTRSGAATSAALRALDLHSPVREIDELMTALLRQAEARDGVEAELRGQQARLRAILDTVPVGVVIAAPSGEIVEGNRRLAELIGPGRPLAGSFYSWPLYHADGTLVPDHELPMYRVLRGEAELAAIECLAEANDGGRVWIRKTAAPIRDQAGPSKGAVTGGVASIVNIDREKRSEEILERKVVARTRELEAANRNLVAEMASRQEAEQQLRQLQKMEAIGHLSGGIAHDFNNMLAVVMSGLNLVERRIAKGDYDVGKYLELAREGVNRAATLTKRLLAFSRQQPLAPLPTDINRLVSGMSDLLRRTLGPSVQLETVLAGGLWPVNIDVNQLENAILNLAINARDAMLEKTGSEDADRDGRLTIETANYLLDETYARQHGDVPAGQYVLIAVSDTGGGMTPEVMAKAFDPFFTTKGPGKGTGLGLSMVYGFVKQSGGHVKIYSELGQGTTIKVYLPRHYGVAPEADDTAASEETAHGGKGQLILVVEDEDNMRRLSSDLLRELGYNVLAASSAANALTTLAAHPEVALVFTDIVMPEMNGRKLADEVEALRPGLPVIFTTGFTRNAVVHNGVLDPGVNFLPKPFTLQQLGEKIRDVLQRAPQAPDARSPQAQETRAPQAPGTGNA